MKPNVVVCSKEKYPIISLLFQSFDNHEERLTTLFLRCEKYAWGISF